MGVLTWLIPIRCEHVFDNNVHALIASYEKEMSIMKVPVRCELDLSCEDEGQIQGSYSCSLL